MMSLGLRVLKSLSGCSPKVSTFTPVESYPHDEYRMAILRKWTRCPRLAIIEFLNAVLLNVKPYIEPPKSWTTCWI
jgi:hypothetical protein